MKLELVSEDSRLIGAAKGKQRHDKSGGNPWRGKHDRRKYPREADTLIEMPPETARRVNER